MTHPIFADIGLGNLAEVQRRVLTTPEVLEERGPGGTTPLMHAIWMRNDQIARWLIHHRSHSLGAVSNSTWTPLHWACFCGPLRVVKALVGARANPAVFTAYGLTPLMCAAMSNQAAIVAFLLDLPTVKATIDAANLESYTALSFACWGGYQPIVELLLEAGADPTISAGQRSPLNYASSQGHKDIAALVRQAIAAKEAWRASSKFRLTLILGLMLTIISLFFHCNSMQREIDQLTTTVRGAEDDLRSILNESCFVNGTITFFPASEASWVHRASAWPRGLPHWCGTTISLPSSTRRCAWWWPR